MNFVSFTGHNKIIDSASIKPTVTHTYTIQWKIYKLQYAITDSTYKKLKAKQQFCLENTKHWTQFHIKNYIAISNVSALQVQMNFWFSWNFLSFFGFSASSIHVDLAYGTVIIQMREIKRNTAFNRFLFS